MAARKRKAKYDSTLVYMDEPHVITLKAGDSFLIAVALHSDDSSKAPFLASTVAKKDWEAYLDGNVDLRYLFTYPTQRIDYYFDLAEMVDGEVKMTRIEGKVPEEHLPLSRFFSGSHTEEIKREKAATNVEKLMIDGEWDMPDFGSFYSRYSDLYYFLSSTEKYADPHATDAQKRPILDAFLSRPFRGGFSYVHLFDDLAAHTGRSERLAVDKIKYESPGFVAIHGVDEIFDEAKGLIEHFLESREALKAAYSQLHAYLSTNKYLKMSGQQYDNSFNMAGSKDYIYGRSKALALAMNMPHIETIETLVQRNALVFAKVILSFYRRLDETAKFFAQGRVSFSDPSSDTK